MDGNLYNMRNTFSPTPMRNPFSPTPSVGLSSAAGDDEYPSSPYPPQSMGFMVTNLNEIEILKQRQQRSSARRPHHLPSAVTFDTVDTCTATITPLSCKSQSNGIAGDKGCVSSGGMVRHRIDELDAYDEGKDDDEDDTEDGRRCFSINPIRIVCMRFSQSSSSGRWSNRNLKRTSAFTSLTASTITTTSKSSEVVGRSPSCHRVSGTDGYASSTTAATTPPPSDSSFGRKSQRNHRRGVEPLMAPAAVERIPPRSRADSAPAASTNKDQLHLKASLLSTCDVVVSPNHPPLPTTEDSSCERHVAPPQPLYDIDKVVPEIPSLLSPERTEEAPREGNERYILIPSVSPSPCVGVGDVLLGATTPVPTPVRTKAQKFFDMAVDSENKGLLIAALEHYRESLRHRHLALIASSVSYKGDPEVAKALFRMGIVQWKMGNYDEAMKCLEKSNDVCSHIGDCISELARIWHAMGTVRRSLGQWSNAMECFRRSLSLRRRSCKSDGTLMESDAEAARTLVAMGSIYDSRGRVRKAVRCYLKALDVQRLVRGDNHVDVAETLVYLGAAHERSGNTMEAMRYYSESLFRYRMALGHNHADVAATLAHVGRIHYLWGEYDEALRAYDEALRVSTKILGRVHRNVAAILYDIASVYASRLHRDDEERALGIFRDVLHMQRAALSDGHCDIATTLDTMAEVYENQGRFGYALKLHEKALTIRRNAAGTLTCCGMHPDILVGVAADRMARCHERCGQHREACARYEEALEWYKVNGLKANHPLIVEAMGKIHALHSKHLVE